MGYQIRKVLRSSKRTVAYEGRNIDVFVSEVAFTPNRRYPDKMEKHEGQSESAVNKAWNGHVGEWSGYVADTKFDGAVVYENVPFSPIFWESEYSGVCGVGPNGPARAIGFLKRYGRAQWMIVQTYDARREGTVFSPEGPKKVRIVGVIKDGKYAEEQIPA